MGSRRGTREIDGGKKGMGTSRTTCRRREGGTVSTKERRELGRESQLSLEPRTAERT
jgi:hypothetical protein